MLTTAILGGAFWAIQCWWLATNRFPGLFDVDEEGGIYAALRFHRGLANGPIQLWDTVMAHGNGPVVPLLSVPFMVVFGRSAITAMYVQPALVVVTAVACSAIANRLAGRGPALLSGITVLLLPVFVVSSRSYQYSTGVGATLALAMWALLASDRGRLRWPMVGFGAAVAAMTMSRTMAVGFVPGVALAALLLLDLRSPAVRRNVAVAAVVAAIVALPWWLHQYAYVQAYLAENAYGSRAKLWGSSSYRGRLGDHLRYLWLDTRLLVFVAAAGLAILLSTIRRATMPSAARWLRSHRELAACIVVIAFGTVVLLSTANRGFWFATPLDALMVPTLISLLHLVPDHRISLPRTMAWVAAMAGGGILLLAIAEPSAPGWLLLVPWVSVVLLLLAAGDRWRPALAATTVAVLAAGLVASLAFPGSGASRPEGQPARTMLMGDLDEVQGGNHDADLRTAAADVGVRRAAADDWLAAATAVDDHLLEITETFAEAGETHYTKSLFGSGHLFNFNTIGLARELGPQGIRDMRPVNTLEPPDEVLEANLTPWIEGRPRVVLLVRERSLAFPDGRGTWRLPPMLAEGGWERRNVVELPDGGSVTIWTHPTSDPTR